MTAGKLRFMHNDQRGFTLLELIIAIAIAGLITAGITMAIMQILTINHRASNHMVAVRQVQQAGKEVSKDALQAQPSKIDVSPPDGAFLVLNWTDSQGGNNTVIYTLQTMASAPALSMLARNHTIDGDAQATAPPVVAEYIDPDQTTCAWNATLGVLVFNVTATVGTESETRIYEIDPRPTQ